MKVRRFLGRQHELKLLGNLIAKQSASMVVVSGRRRIGKSRLIKEFGSSYEFYSFAGLPPAKGITAQTQREYFAKNMSQVFAMPMPPQDDWADLFWYLADRVKVGRQIILFDELSWMAKGDETFLGKLKTAWDDWFQTNPELVLVLCSSVSVWLEKNIVLNTGFMGRLSLDIHLPELSIYYCNEFWGARNKRISSYEKLKFLSVSGGVPRYLEEIKPSLSAEENIKQLCLDKRSLLFKEFEHIFSDLFVSDTGMYRKIVFALADGAKEYNELCDILNIQANSIFSDYLSELIQAGFVRRDYTWHIQTGKQSALSHFYLSDNYMRFYIKYILPRKQQILNDEFIEMSASSIPGWSSIMGLQFENLVLNNRASIKKLLNIQPGETIAEGPYFQRHTAKAPGCQIDYMIQTKFKALYVCEIKFSKEKLGKKVVDECQAKIDRLKIPKGFSYRLVLIHVNGVTDSVIESDFFTHIIDFSELLTLS